MEPCLQSEERTVLSPIVVCIRKFNAILIVAITAVATAVIISFLSSAISFLENQTFAIESQSVTDNSQVFFGVFEAIPATPNEVEHLAKETDDEHTNLIFVLDFWERMINIQSGLRRLVNIGVESGFTVVEPFIYESRIRPSFSDPSHFTMQNMTPQSAMHYFQTQDLLHTNRYISYEKGRKRIERIKGNEDYATGMATNRNAVKTYEIQAAVFFDWPDEVDSREGNRRLDSSERSKGLAFWWCNDKLRRMVTSNLGYMLSQSIFIEQAVCLSVKDTMAPSILTPQYFHSLFQFVKNGTNKTNRKCSECVALAFMNYRKHAFNGFRSNLGMHPFKQKVPPLEVSSFGKELAARVKTDVLRNRPYVAIQIRTGKMFVLFEKYENKLLREGIKIARYSSFKTWLQSCTRKISMEAKAESRQLGRRAVYYIASDMFNDGWKGGEECPDEVKQALDDAEQYLWKALHRIYRFDPNVFGVRQDVMGVGGIADAAVCRDADKFLFARPSNFGRWVAEQREVAGIGAVTIVNCMDDRLPDV